MPEPHVAHGDLDNLTAQEVASWKNGDRLLLNGAMLTGRDAAHKRIQDMLAKGELKAKVDMEVARASAAAVEAVEKAGGKITQTVTVEAAAE